MPMVNPLVNGDAGGSWNVAQARRMPEDQGTVTPPVGSGRLAGNHNTPMHCAGMILIALAVIFGLKLGGFRFAFDVGMGRT